MELTSYIIWIAIILICFILAGRLTFQIREKKKTTLNINFSQAKEREKKRTGP
ncbi:hypothetical protein JCM15519_08820 [Fundidesulfovibrio butyratiphilus]